MGYRRKITEFQDHRHELENELREIDKEQGRIRQNLEKLDRNSALSQQYVKKLTDQEARIEEVRAETARLREAERVAENQLREFVDELTE